MMTQVLIKVLFLTAISNAIYSSNNIPFNSFLQHSNACKSIELVDFLKIVDHLFPKFNVTSHKSCLTKVHLGTVTNTSLVLDTPTSLDLGASYLLSLLAYDHCSPETADMLFNGSTTSATVATAGGILNFADVLKSLQRRSVLRYTPADKCFDAGSISGSEQATQILVYLVQGYNPVELCNRVDFISEIYEIFGIEHGENMFDNAFEKLLEKMKISGNHDDHEGHDDHESQDKGHEERKRRSTDEKKKHAHAEVECLGESVLRSFGVDVETVGIDHQAFRDLCPALLHQSISGVCTNDAGVVKSPIDPITNKQKYGYGTLAVVVVSLASLIGIVFIPCLKRRVYQDFLAVFIALAVGTLTGDALMHLLPFAFGLHEHADGHEHGSKLTDTTKKALVAIAAIWSFYLLEAVMTMLTGNSHGHSHNDLEIEVISDVKICNDDIPNIVNNKDEKKQKKLAITAIGWMVLIGDGVHNFADGLAMGAAFSHSSASGWSTSIAVLCHELPHELGDFAVLINSGMSWKRAAILNLISALTAICGFYIGAAISNQEEIRIWIFTITSGMFLYLALADMFPEMIKMLGTGSKWRTFMLQNIGLFIGFSIMTLISVYEDKLHF